MFKFSVVTVCYNAEKTIQKTIESVLAQDYPNIEYLIIDGASTDKTLQLIKRHKSKLIKVLSEKDEGVYDAMNKALKIATGEVIYFLNSGDRFYDSTVVSKIARVFKSSVDLVYGNVMTEDGSQKPLKFNQVNKMFLLSHTICHQALFARKSLFVEYGNFDTQYSIAADYDWLLRLYSKVASRFLYIDETIAYYDMNGMSNNLANRKRAQSEQNTIARTYYDLVTFGLEKAFLSVKRALSIAYRSLTRKSMET